ncbi:GNAT family N-acetyltransferase [Bacillus sp. AFS002410]|uniref:GNAT family N-acetyltransferase n=1 Tax=Bacillus sp. AFS002410 TaxID=2033481 RepID=UPI000BF0BE20|nr:GNAT family N-acetyltransferase [Bacillus sp. AFS002410]PEJ57197.1 GNAT family N-acetyltransferase [Bacillus sp. AFS002410]
MEIRKALVNDYESIVFIDSQVIGSRKRENKIHNSIKENRCIVCEINKSIGGFLIFHKFFFGHLFIDLIIVSPRMRRLGIARNLMEYIEKIGEKKVFSSTNQSNSLMQNVFYTLGYIESGTIENLDEGDPEIVFVKVIH